jgi:hypothetical protein
MNLVRRMSSVAGSLVGPRRKSETNAAASQEEIRATLERLAKEQGLEVVDPVKKRRPSITEVAIEARAGIGRRLSFTAETTRAAAANLGRRLSTTPPRSAVATGIIIGGTVIQARDTITATIITINTAAAAASIMVRTMLRTHGSQHLQCLLTEHGSQHSQCLLTEHGSQHLQCLLTDGAALCVLSCVAAAGEDRRARSVEERRAARRSHDGSSHSPQGSRLSRGSRSHSESLLSEWMDEDEMAERRSDTDSLRERPGRVTEGSFKRMSAKQKDAEVLRDVYQLESRTLGAQEGKASSFKLHGDGSRTVIV